MVCQKRDQEVNYNSLNSIFEYKNKCLMIRLVLEFKGGYNFSGNTYEIFEKFFGTSNPHTIVLDGKTTNRGLEYIN